MSVDWYEIDISGAVDSITEQQIIDQCFETGAPNICALINRDSGGTAVGIGAPFLNLSTSFAEGVDFEVAYNTEVNFFDSNAENLSVRLLAGSAT